MTIKNPVISCFTMLFSLIFSHAIAAGTVYKWTDEEGNIHFSDVPPVATEQSDAEEINIFIGEDEYGDPDQYSIINQADRMAERRRQESRERLEKKRLYLEEKRLELAQAQITREEDIEEQEVYRPVYGLYSGPVYGHYPGPVYGQYSYNNRGFRKSGYGYGYGYKSTHGYKSGHGFKSGHGYKSGHDFREPVSSMPNLKKRLISGPGRYDFKSYGSRAVINF